MRRWVVCVPLLLAWRPAAAAAPPWLHDIFTGLATMSDTLTASIDRALTRPEIETVVHVLFTSLALFLFAWRFAGMALRGFDLMDIIELMFTIFFVYVLLSSYRHLIPAIIGAGRFVADSLGTTLSGATSNASMAESIFGELMQLSLRPRCGHFWDCISTGLPAIIGTLLGYAAIIILGIAATLVEVWAQWGFEIAYAIGWFTIPFLLFRRLSFMFDGWVRFLFTAVMFELVGKITLSMVLLGLNYMLGIAPLSMGARVDVHRVSDLVGLFFFIAVGLMSLLSTGQMASTLVAGSKGVHGVLHDMAQGLTKAFGR